METYIALLRGINVSGQKKVNMKELKALFEENGYANVVTYIQSGNVVFQKETKEASILKEEIERMIATRFNFDVPVILRTLADFKNIVLHNPFRNNPDWDINLYVTFLETEPGKEPMEKLLSMDYSQEKFTLLKKEIFLFCPNGYGRTKFNNNFFEQKLKIKATTRNWKTINTLIHLAEDI